MGPLFRDSLIILPHFFEFVKYFFQIFLIFYTRFLLNFMCAFLSDSFFNLALFMSIVNRIFRYFFDLLLLTHFHTFMSNPVVHLLHCLFKALRKLWSTSLFGAEPSRKNPLPDCSGRGVRGKVNNYLFTQTST